MPRINPEDVTVDASRRGPDKTYRYTFMNGGVDEHTGYLVVTPDFIAVCQDEGDIQAIAPLAVIQSVKAVEAVAGRA